MSIYVEILVRGSIDQLWNHTQIPHLHERWDLRFSRIDYLPRHDERAPQRFRYTTRIGFGLAVSGEGEASGRRDLAGGESTSALKFSSDERLSVIREGSGYWKYIPTADGVRFLTWYDYRTRFGAAGELFDRFVFRPLIGWATAWSFDRLRLWIEQGVDPTLALRRALVHAGIRAAVAAIVLRYLGFTNPALAVVLLVVCMRAWPANTPSAARCVRRPGKEQP